MPNSTFDEPDPATRALLYEAWFKGSDEGAAIVEHGERHKDMHLPTFDQWLRSKFPPPLPEEPPDGTVLRGKGQDAGHQDLWERDDECAAGARDRRWWRSGDAGAHTWAEAYEMGADPARRLVKLPDLNSAPDMLELGTAVEELLGKSQAATYPQLVRVTVRALAERGQR